MGSQGSRAGSTLCCQARKEPACLLLLPTKPLCAMLGQPRAAQGCGRGGAALPRAPGAGQGWFREGHSLSWSSRGCSLSLLAPQPSPGQELSPGSLCLLLRGKPSSLGAPEAGFGMESARPSPPERSAHSGTDIIISALLGLCSSVLERGINLHLAARFVQLDGRASLPWQHLARQGSDPSVPAGNVISSATVEAARKRGLIFNSRPGVVAAPQRCFPTPPRGSSRKNAAES